MIFDALPSDIRQQVNTPVDYAYALWKWLEVKFQSTEADAVAVLFKEWADIKQNEDEPFDAYRSRLNRLRDRLAAAKEQSSPAQYSWVFMNRLLPHFSTMVLTLKAGTALKDPATTDWDRVSALMNEHQRNLKENDSSSSEERTMAVRSKGGKPYQGSRTDGQSKDYSQLKCYNCGREGHPSYKCMKPRMNNDPRNQKRSETAASAVGADYDPIFCRAHSDAPECRAPNAKFYQRITGKRF